MQSSNIKRLAAASLISSSVFAATYIWYKSSEVRYSQNSDEKALAFAAKVVEDIQRRPASRLLWQNIDAGEALYNGEAIRTPSNGEVRIQFADSDRYIDLEADSLIVIKKSEGDIALDLMEGSLFVNAASSASGTEADGDKKLNLVLTADGSKVDLSKASASLSRGKNNKLDVQVLEGKAAVIDKSGNSKELQSGQSGAVDAKGITFNQEALQILSPPPAKTLYRAESSDGMIRFAWKGFPAQSQVTLWVGPSRKNLTAVQTTSVGNAQEIMHSLPIGKHFWKISAKDPQGQDIGESPIYRNEIMARLNPTVLFPQADLDLPIEQENYDLTFKWQKTPDTKFLQLEVWADAKATKPLLNKSFAVEDSFTIPQLPAGTYYWRLSGHYFDDSAPYVGKVEKFTLTPKAKIPVNIPVQWSQLPDNGIQYFIQEPSLNLEWSTPQPEAVSLWRLKVRPEGEPLDAAMTSEFKESRNQVRLNKPGRYIASIEAVDSNGRVIGTAPETVLESAPAPLLPPPQFNTNELVIKASNDGRTELVWSPIPGAKEYVMSIMRNGKELKQSRYPSNATSLKNLMPGEYEVRLQTVDEHGRLGEFGESKKIQVPETSGLKAPSLKKIKVN